MAAKSAKIVLNGERSEYEGNIVLTNGITVNVELTEDLKIEYEEGVPYSLTGTTMKLSLIDNVSGTKLLALSPTLIGDDLYITVGLSNGGDDDDH